MSSINLGEPLVKSNPNSRIALEIRRIAGSLGVGTAPIEEVDNSKRSVWNSLFKRESTQLKLS